MAHRQCLTLCRRRRPLPRNSPFGETFLFDVRGLRVQSLVEAICPNVVTTTQSRP